MSISRLGCLAGLALTLWAADGWATNLVSEGGYTFDVQDGLGGSYSLTGELSDGSSNAYDGSYALRINGVTYSASGAGTPVVDGRTVLFPQLTMGGSLLVSRQVTVPESGGDYARYVDTVTNTGTESVTVEVRYVGNLGSDSSTVVWGTASGDLTVDVADYWFGTDDVPYAPTEPGDPALGHLFYGPGAAVEPTSLGLGPTAGSYGSADDLHCAFDVALGPGDSAAFVIFAFQGPDDVTVQAQVEEVVEDFGVVTEDLPSETLSLIVNWSADADGDGYRRGRGADGDCDDRNPAVHPGAEESCDGFDNDCDGELDEGFERTPFYPDGDRDGFGQTDGVVMACVAPPGFVSRPGDCDDTRADTRPGGMEYCDSRDNDCDGEVDEDVESVDYFPDNDLDGYGALTEGVSSCTPMPGWTTLGGDCDDTCPTCYPGHRELCDGLDNNCMGGIDEGLEKRTYYRDSDGDGHGLNGSGRLDCVQREGWATRDGDCDDRCATCFPGNPEVCDERDNDCDGEIDEELTYVTYYQDQDGDGFGLETTGREDCIPTAGWATKAGDCDDTCSTCFPGASEQCDERDNDCDGEVDEELTFATYFRDSDRDGYGINGSARTTCREMPSWASVGGDCNDRCEVCFPSAEEICDGLDNDCDGEVDEELTLTLWVDADGDGFGNPPSRREACEPLEGYVDNGDDCHDANASVYPDAPEICDGRDNDCDGETDEEVKSVSYIDRDEDGFGDPEEPMWGCEIAEGYADNADDCNDDEGQISPVAAEIAGDEIDNDCDGEVDEELALQDAGPKETDADLAEGDTDGGADSLDAGIDGSTEEPQTDSDSVDGDSSSADDNQSGCACRVAAPSRVGRGLIATLLGWLF